MTGDRCKIEEGIVSGVVFRLRQEPWRILLSLASAGAGFLGTMMVIACVLVGFQEIVVRPGAVPFIFGLGAVFRFTTELASRRVTFSEYGMQVSPHYVAWNDVFSVRVLRQEGRYVELCIDWMSWMTPRRVYVAGYVLDDATPVTESVARYGGPEKLA
jgi:hypothetical protein